jgi:hypothetical protein
MAIVLFLAPALFIKADTSLVSQRAKVSGVVAAVLGLLGCYLCRSTSYLNTRSRDPATWRKFAFSMVVVVDMVYSGATAGQAAAGCFKVRPTKFNK